MNLGPYFIQNKKICYKGNKIYKSIKGIAQVKAPSLKSRHIEIREDHEKWAALIKIWDGVYKACNAFMDNNHALLFDLPITTRMISSPGALSGTIISDVDPFEIKFFNNQTFLTQSSQLYLEFAITNPKINKVYCWEKSFRREKADFRHLPEFTHIEFEANIEFEDNLKIQQNFLQFVISFLIKNYKKDLLFFLDQDSINSLREFTILKKFSIITFEEAFKFLKDKTNDSKYDKITIENFGAVEEVLLTEIIGEPVFVTNYYMEEVAFYHSNDPINPKFVINADFLFPGYGELIGSGERVHTKEEMRFKTNHFRLNLDDYQPYIDSRHKNSKIHSGWGMGIERFVQAILKLPFIWESKPFPRIHNQNRP